MRKITILAFTAISLMLASCNGSGSNKAPTGDALPKVSAPAGKAWTDVVSKTADGGFLQGNPDAKVKLIEYGALSCPHCAHFAEESHDGMAKLIDAGQVNYEFRTFLIHPQDVPASLLAHCAGPEAFFPMAEQMFATQMDWLGKSSTITAEDQAAWGKMTPNGVATAMAGKLGLVDFVKERGLSEEKAKACLADKAGIDLLNNISKVGSEEKHITGTPSFFINGTPLTISSEPTSPSVWVQVKTALENAGAR